MLFDGFEIQLEHLIMADVPFLFVLTLAVTVLLWDPKPSFARCTFVGFLLGAGAVLRSVGLPMLAIFAVYMIIRRSQLAEGHGHDRGVPAPRAGLRVVV